MPNWAAGDFFPHSTPPGILDCTGRSTESIKLYLHNSNFRLGDYYKARNRLNWKLKVSFQELLRIMTEYDLDLAEREAHALQFRKH